jgi:hypothetical protein
MDGVRPFSASSGPTRLTRIRDPQRRSRRLHYPVVKEPAGSWELPASRHPCRHLALDLWGWMPQSRRGSLAGSPRGSSRRPTFPHPDLYLLFNRFGTRNTGRGRLPTHPDAARSTTGQNPPPPPPPPPPPLLGLGVCWAGGSFCWGFGSAGPAGAAA